ncbi:sucrose:sucrose 1-fructosyltransferase-like [Phragmites australis]|uniref:sucrose:sucrose 1-fructosyltransferase-like n=1 Tax=Phragmites australis TaxID=29695 RepID=UPI002D765BC6|nr:sucrose:sucrose 1-fructosyltransferase-like [Phragmites australis]
MQTRDSNNAPLPYSYSPLPAADAASAEVTGTGCAHGRRRPLYAAALVLSAALLLAAGVLLAGRQMKSMEAHTAAAVAPEAMSRGPEAGVSEKTSGAAHERLGAAGDSGNAFPWSNAMLQWQRTGFHFQPEKNWMNDPNGPLYYKGWYHLFYQYNPEGAIWGDKIAWGHAVSRDLIHWCHLPLAMVPDQWYDINGVWTGSATTLPDGRLAMLYTGCTNESVQVQCLAVPSDPNDQLLTNWTKYEGNPVLYPPPGIGPKDFRDPTTAWYDPSDKTWRTVIGSKDPHHAGIAVTYRTKDLVNYELLPGELHRVPGTGMWECIDFYPVGTRGDNGIDMSDAMSKNGVVGDVVHVMKASMDDDRHDYYALGRYNATANAWTPMDPENDIGIGLRYDWGKFYASKTFYDPAKRRRVLWGWVGETDSERADVAKGWASLQSIPRTVLLDTKTGGNLLQWPVEEIETLRTNSTDLSGITIDYGSVFPLNLHRATQLDILAEFELDKHAVMAINEADVGYNCSTSGGAANRGALGPFGLLVLADNHRREQTAVYFYVAKGLDGRLTTHFCQDESRSSSANDIVKRVVGSVLPVLDGETLSVRVLVDHSIVESFAQGGRSTATSRVYPTEAIYANAGVYLFNNATSARVTAKTLVVHEMDSSYNQVYMAEL